MGSKAKSDSTLKQLRSIKYLFFTMYFETFYRFLSSIHLLFQEINVGDSEVVLTGGAENMSLSPHAVRGIRFGVRLGQDVVVSLCTQYSVSNII